MMDCQSTNTHKLGHTETMRFQIAKAITRLWLQMESETSNRIFAGREQQFQNLITLWNMLDDKDER